MPYFLQNRKPHSHVLDFNNVPPGPCRHPVYSAADTRPLPLVREEEVQALPRAASRPLQAQDDASLAASGKVGAPIGSF